MVGVIGVALAAFVIGDGLQSGSTWFSNNQRIVLSVDGEDIMIEDYERRFQMLTEQMQQQGGQLSDEQRMNLNNGLSQQIIADHILKRMADQVGIKVTSDEVYALIHSGHGVAPSPLAQQFFASVGIDINDTQAVNDFILQISDNKIKALPEEQQTVYRNIQAQWQALQEQIITNRLQEKLGSLLSRSYKITKLDTELATGQGARTVALVRTIPLAGTDKADQPTEQEIQKYYDARQSLFTVQSPSAEVSYIATQVTPSSDDYKEAEAKAQKAYTELQAASDQHVGDVVRNLGGTFNPSYFTGAELDQLGLSDAEIEFIKTSALGATYSSGLVNDKYSLLKLTGKKSGVEAVGLQVIVLDSVMSVKADSLVAALKSGANFEEMVAKYSQDAESKNNGGRISQQGQYGIPMDTFTEAQLAGSPFAEAFTKPIGEAFTVNNGATRIILKTTDAKPATEKYQLALVTVDASFSDKTYNAKYDEINRILGAGGSFEEMSKKATEAGFSVVKGISVNTSSANLGVIPSSRAIVQWALNAEDGALTDKVYRLGTDYLAIAQVTRHYQPGAAPLSMVKDNIVAALSAKKRAENLAQSVSAKGLTSLGAYATEFNTTIDTLSNVNYLVRGSEPAAFNGKAMVTAIGQLSKPFVAGTEVMVIQPIATTTMDPAEVKAQARQAEQGTGYQLVGRAFQNQLQRTKIEDNRARFY